MTAEQQHSMLQELRRPFTAAAVRFKPQTWNAERKSGIAICYIDARLVVERLNRIVGLDWHDEYERLDATTMLCRLTVCGTQRQDVGVAESSAAGGLKALYSDSLKRAAVRFGVGVSLYAVPQLRIDANDVWVKRDGKPGGLSDSGLVKLRRLYEQWLKRQGSAFGEPLDHGDDFDSVGEVADAPAEPEVVVGEVVVEQSAPKQKAQGLDTFVDHDLGAVAEQLAAIGPEGRKRLKAHLRRLGVAPEQNTQEAWFDAIIENFAIDYNGRPMYANLEVVLKKLDEQAETVRMRDDDEDGGVTANLQPPKPSGPTPLQRQEASDRLYDDEAERLAAAAGLPMYGETAPS